jgi:type II secretory pathway predicted ATPase ExeA
MDTTVRATDVWLEHWGLLKDPFASADSPYVALPSHDEAAARLTHAIEQSHRLAILRAEAGLGKSVVLRRAIADTWSERRTCITVRPPSDGTELIQELAGRLSKFAGNTRCRQTAWQTIRRAICLAGLERRHLVLAIDDWDERLARAAPRDLETVARMGADAGSQVTVILVSRDPRDAVPQPGEAWILAIGLERLTQSQAASYLETKFLAAGCRDRVFTPRATTQLHARSLGIPRGLEQLASLSLMAGAVRGLEVIPPDLVDGAARECVRIPGGAFA